MKILKLWTITFLLQYGCQFCCSKSGPLHEAGGPISSSSVFEEWFSRGSDTIKCILCDIDGTFIDSAHHVDENTIAIIKKLMEKGCYFFPATGRARKSTAAVTGNALSQIFQCPTEHIPGVYAQGLTVYGADGNIIFERFLELDTIEIAEQFCTKHNLSLIAYSGDQIYCRKRSKETDCIDDYCEPFPLEYPSGLTQLQLIDAKVNKLIILADEERLNQLRPVAEKVFSGRASLTKAVPSMLEVLPLGASKGDGVLKLLDNYGLQPHEVMAFGDGENDIEMMQIVKYSVAMANAKPSLKQVSAAITKSNNDHGVGHVLSILLKSISS